MEPVLLNDWIRANPPPERMYWSVPAREQLEFVRDELRSVAGIGAPVVVIAEHRSKSILLPVYFLQHEKVRFYLRNNFFNWKLSVVSETPIEVDLTGLCHTTPPVEPDYTGNPLSPVYFEGFPRELVFGYYEQNKARWSAEFHGDFELATAMFLIMRALGEIGPLVWRTRALHEARVAALRDL